MGKFGEVVICPGDPIRAKWLADNFLTNVECINTVRGNYTYTGMYEGVKLSVHPTGMGLGSCGIFFEELMK